MHIQTTLVAVSAIAAVNAAAAYERPKPVKAVDYIKDKTIPFPITKDGKKLNTALVLDNGWFDSKKKIGGIFPNTVKNWEEAGITVVPGGAKFVKPISRVYVVNGDKYEMLNLNNKQISFEVDISGVGCGYNAAGYTTGINRNAKIGEGYCDGQNFCNEMDLLESNIGSQAYTPHPCTDTKHINGTTKCDPWGCNDNAYKNHLALYGPNKKHINSLKPFRVYTQFAGTGHSYVTRAWMQQGANILRFNDMDDQFCQLNDPFWRNTNSSASLPNPVTCPGCDYHVMEKSYKDNGQVLTFSFWGSGGEGMNWLDGGALNENCVYQPTWTGFIVRDVVIEDNQQAPFTNA